MKMQKPITVIRYSLVPVFLGKGNRLRFFSCFLILPMLWAVPAMIWDVIQLRSRYIEVYEAYVIKKWGVFHKNEEKHMFPKIEACKVRCTFWQRVFKYGTIEIKTLGNRFNLGLWDDSMYRRRAKARKYDKQDPKVDPYNYSDAPLEDIKNPFLVRKHLEKHFITAKEIKAMRQTIISN